MDELPKMIRDAMDDKSIGIRPLAREAERKGLKLSTGTISDYRNGNLPRTIRRDTLEAFSILLNIPMSRLLESAGVDDDPERMSLQESLAGLEPRQQKLIRQLISELAHSNRTHSNDHHDDSPRHLQPVQDADRPDAGEEQKIAARNQPDPNIGMEDEPEEGP